MTKAKGGGPMKISQVTNDLLSVAQAAEALGVARLTVYRRISRGKMEVIRVGGTIFVLASEVERVQKLSLIHI